ncbi:MAG: DNA photolyase family protein [Fibrobacterota bacterium]|nr:DNA photolyase family protein [Fibrobacterota bacterium]
MTASTLVWFRQDLRLSDHPALHAALRHGPVIPLYIYDSEAEGAWAPGGASRWWLHHSLTALDLELRKKGSRLILRRGNSSTVIAEMIRETGAEAVHWNRRYEPAADARDQKLLATLRETGLQARVYNAALLYEPGSILTGTGGPYQVFTPFWRACRAAPQPPPPLPAPPVIPVPTQWPAALELGGFGLLPGLDWAAGLRNTWQPGSQGARELLEGRIEHTLPEYETSRDIPNQEGTSRLSPHLHFGEIGIREVWTALKDRLACLDVEGGRSKERDSLLAYQRQLIWREFAHHLLVHFPLTPSEPLRPRFAAFPWEKDGNTLEAWQRGQTGYPFVDAGMRQLWATGWMHNRVRMAASSFLVKHLLQPWQAGAKWFWDTLVDADLAQNTMGWQWVAGCGADAAPYFRIFNPVTQGERFDPQGDYVRRWVPELAGMDAKWIHRPWEAPEAILTRAKVSLGGTYPRPIVDHPQARARALAAYHSLLTNRSA